MQKIWYTMWEVMYACIQNNAPENIALSIIERYVNRTYQDAVEDLKESNVINEETEEKAKEQSNIEIMAMEYLKQRKRNKILRYVRLCFLLIGVGIIVTALVLAFKVYGVIAILTIMVVYNLVSHERVE